ncbi:MAG: U32 family peptidase [Candidatus Riflebacteria bacterium]|nr:U32 family peptidase [Candidatus Riflebacteria bacterium]
MTKKKPELLAPAGDKNALKAACLAGADAVYLAGKRFGARAFASNFDEQGLIWARRVTRSLNKKLYITVNTLVFENELKLLRHALEFYMQLAPDALIIQDLAVALELSKLGGQIPLHLSTQGAFFPATSTEVLEDLGISRVILPREATLEEIKAFRNKTSLELESFIHGAMCYSISGRCFWSRALGTRSGNRGTCAQPCRKEYWNNKIDREKLFSPKDLILASDALKLAEVGVNSLKIEGRMKSDDYVYETVFSYRQIIDGEKLEPEKFKSVFARESGKGFIGKFPKIPGIWRTTLDSGNLGQEVAVVSGNPSDGMLRVSLKAPLSKGDGMLWFDNKGKNGAKITWIQSDKKSSDVFLRGLPPNLPKGTVLYRTFTENIPDWKSRWDPIWERQPVVLYWSGRDNTPLAVETFINGEKFRIETEELLQIADKKGLEEGILQERFDVLGDTFRAEKHVMTMLGKHLFIRPGALKELKRDFVKKLYATESQGGSLMKGQGELTPVLSKSLQKKFEALDKELSPVCEEASEGKEQPSIGIRVWNNVFPFIKDLMPDYWILPWHGQNETALRILKQPVRYWLPPVINLEEFDSLAKELAKTKPGNFLCFGWEAFELQKLFPQHKFTLDWTFNIGNSLAAGFVNSRGINCVLSREIPIESQISSGKLAKTDLVWNPAVSFSRFGEALPPKEKVRNAHKDFFFAFPVSSNVTAMFLSEKNINVPFVPGASVQIDLAVAPDENIVQLAKQLSKVIRKFRLSSL